MGRPTTEGAEASSRLASILVVDMVAFSRLSTVEQLALRSGMFEALREALDSTGIPFDECYREDRGDGVLVIAPARFRGEVLLGRLPEELQASIKGYNFRASSRANLQLRAAVGRGQVIHDQHGVVGTLVNSVFRMVDAAPVKTAARNRGADLVLVASDALFREAKESIDAGGFEEVAVRVKETNSTAWMRVYGGRSDEVASNVVTAGVVHGDIHFYTPTVSPQLPVPFQLPAPTPDFVGRERALADLDAALARVKDGQPVTVMVEGMAGVGKTALALRWAYQVRDRFPDGQLWADLGGAASDSEAVDSAEILADFLMALGAPRERIPEGLDARARLYRTMLHRKRVLVILDNAHSDAQVRALIPGESSSVTIVTTRNRLRGLVVWSGAQVMRLGQLSLDEGVALLESILGRRRVEADPDAAAALVHQCGHLPLALRIAAANLQLYPGDRISDAVRELVEAGEAGDRGDTVRAAFGVSYRSLDDDVRRAFRLLSLVEGLDFTREATAALLGTGVEESERLLDDLVKSNLIESVNPGHFRMHPLLLDYAKDQVQSEEDEATRRAAVNRYVESVRREAMPEAFVTRDFWTTDDRLAYRPYADAITAFIRHADTHPPLTIGVKAPWGAGKTSLMRMVQQSLDPGADTNPIKIRLTPESQRMVGIFRRGRRKGAAEASETRVTNREVLEQAATTADDEPSSEKRRPATRRAEADGRVSTALRAEPAPNERIFERQWRPTVWFNPWIYQNGEQVWAGLAHEIITQVSSRMAIGDRERFWLRLNLRRVDREAVRRRCHRVLFERLRPLLVAWAIGVAVAVCGLLLAPILPTGEDVMRFVSGSVLGGGTLVIVGMVASRVIGFLRGAVAGPTAKLVKEPDLLGGGHRLLSAQLNGSFDKLVPDPGYASKLGFLHLVQTDMKRVLDLVASPQRPLVVFVDDLDRCSPGTVAQVIEAINLFLAGEFPNCVFVLGMEPGAVAAHVEVAYKDLSSAHQQGRLPGDWSTLGWRFLEKIVQLSVSLPPPREDVELPHFVRTLLKLGAKGSSPPRIAAGSGFAPSGTVNNPPATDIRSGAGRTADEPASTEPTGTGVEHMATSDTDVDNRGARPRTPSRSEDGPTLTSADRARLGQAIRDRAPTPSTLREAAIEAQRQVIGVGEPLLPATLSTAEEIFAELYSDAAAHEAITSALSVLATRNPREIKRFINLFRFYTFINQLRRLHGEPAASGEQVAKLAAFAIRWPHLIALLGNADPAHRPHPLAELESSARKQDQMDWTATLRRLLPTIVPTNPAPSWCHDLQAFLVTGPEIGEVAAPLL
ncbi:P-loop NTPase fold protein [Actinoallomurus sp. CA-150999]|uniref:P-loop NTPase fold protein n=1 Tax=Actinoallomurus sp. CA-150999 TaxID=3239887 RepID=UPI003D94ADB4